MKGRRKKIAPASFQDWRAAEQDIVGGATYRKLSGQPKQDLRNSLFQEQRGLCVYCGKKIDLQAVDTFHIEHFRPQSIYNDLQTEYKNLFLSCGQPSHPVGSSGTVGPRTNHCGVFKKNNFSEECVVEPTYPDCVDRFVFMTSGKVKAANPCDENAEYMIEILNLNQDSLVKSRSDFIELVDSGAIYDGVEEETTLDDFFDRKNNLAKVDFAHIIFKRKGEVLP